MATTDWRAFADVDLAIEAVTERLDIKREVFRDLELYCPPNAVLVSNTSALSIKAIAFPLHDPDLSGMPLLLVNPGVALMTGPVFAGWDGIDRGALDPADWRNGRNDLTQSAVALAPGIRALLDQLAAQPGVAFVRMSGSGATCFALFESPSERDAAARQFPFWHMRTELR